MSEGKLIELEDGNKLALMDKWLRITHNPVAPRYPKVGETIVLTKPYRHFLPAGKHTIESIVEYEPAYNKDKDGRDIRLTIVGCLFKELNGENVLECMV